MFSGMPNLTELWHTSFGLGGGRPRKYMYSRWNFTDLLFLTEGFTISSLGAILDSRMSVLDNTSAYPG